MDFRFEIDFLHPVFLVSNSLGNSELGLVWVSAAAWIGVLTLQIWQYSSRAGRLEIFGEDFGEYRSIVRHLPTCRVL